MSDSRYNGWSNYETWCANLWLTNDQGSDSWLRERCDDLMREHDGDKEAAAEDLAGEIESFHDEFYPEVTGLFADLLRSSFDAIDWREIAENALSDLDSEDYAEPAEETEE